tara:strand:+ start:9065 stop:9397 length:333 start_codon:yes stop_codon:yes gene_type:complete
MNHESLIRFAKISHSDAIATWGDGEEADAALGIVRSLQNAPSRPVTDIVIDALTAFTDTLATRRDGMRVGGDNPRDRLDRALATFIDENDLTDLSRPVPSVEPIDTDVPF